MLRLIDPHPFRQGELIKAEVNLPDFRASTGSPSAEQWQFTGLLLDPQTNCGTVIKPCFLNETEFHLMNGPRGVSDRQTLALNSYLPALPPGHYRVAALARKLVRRSYGAGSTVYVYSDPPQYAVSGTVDVEIIAASADWVRNTIARGVAHLNGPQPRDQAGYQPVISLSGRLRSNWRSLMILPRGRRLSMRYPTKRPCCWLAWSGGGRKRAFAT